MALFGPRKKINRAEIFQRLSKYNFPAEVPEKLVSSLEEATESDLSRLQPKLLARQFGLENSELLNLFAAGFREGIFTINWEIECPHCNSNACYFRGPRDSYHQIKCVGCKGQFNAQFDQDIHITFAVHPSIRPAAPTQAAPKLQAPLQILAEPDQTISAHELLTVQAFRDFFRNEALPEGESFEIGRTVLLFTDLTGSTAMYQRRGDPKAYSLVREHFEVLQRAVSDNGGAVVKTIGDAVMAVFTQEKLALQAALQAQSEMRRFNTQRNLSDSDQLLLKIGLHAGPSIYVTLDERLDYFGTTVNTAARVQAQAESNEIVFTDEILNAPGVRELIGQRELRDSEAHLKGIDQAVRLWRLTSLD